MFVRRFVVALLIGLGTALVLAGRAQAQSLSFAPTIGVYIPTTELIKAATGEEFKQEISLSAGARLGFWFGSRLGIEATGQYSPSHLKLSAAGVSQAESANIFTGSGRVAFFIIPPSSPLAVAVTGGVGVINRSGEAYANVENKTDITGTVGASAQFRVGSLVSLQLNVESYIYSPGVASEAGVEEQVQNDIQISFGVGIPLLGAGSSN